jgi:hypothetical protein
MNGKRNRRDFLKNTLAVTGGLFLSRCASLATPRTPSSEVAGGSVDGPGYYASGGGYGASGYAYGNAAPGYHAGYYGANGTYSPYGSIEGAYTSHYYGASTGEAYAGQGPSFYGGYYGQGAYYACPPGYGYFAKGYYGYAYTNDHAVYGYYEPSKQCEPMHRGVRHRFRPRK